MNPIKMNLFVDRIRFHLKDFDGQADKESERALDAINAAMVASEALYDETKSLLHTDLGDDLGDLAFGIHDQLHEFYVIVCDGHWNAAATAKLSTVRKEIDRVVDLVSSTVIVSPTFNKVEHVKRFSGH